MVGRAAADVSFVVTVSGGTYVRVLAADVGRTLGCGAHLATLRRTAIGPFDVAAARPTDDPGDVLPLERAVAHLPRFDVEREEAVAVSHGRILAPGDLEGPYGVYDPDGRLLGIYADDGSKAKPLVILAPATG
jgi:tRNA pseudouridine55 synthase